MANINRNRRQGIRIVGQRGHPEVRAALIRYARWLRAAYHFPIRVPVYLVAHRQITTCDGKAASASFFAPFERDVEPYIRIATGDYGLLLAQRGRDDALAAFIVSLSHEIIHYQQWIETGTVSERGVVRKAVGMLRKYENTVHRP